MISRKFGHSKICQYDLLYHIFTQMKLKRQSSSLIDSLTSFVEELCHWMARLDMCFAQLHVQWLDCTCVLPDCMYDGWIGHMF